MLEMVRPRPPPSPAIVGTGVVAFGVLFLLSAAVLVVRRRAEIARWSRTVGTISGFDVRMSRRKSRQVRIHHPRISFVAGGETVTFTSDVGGAGTRGRAVGDEIAIVYDPQQPQS